MKSKTFSLLSKVALVGFGIVVFGALGCNASKEIQRLRAENDSLKRQIDSLTQSPDGSYSSDVSDVEELIKEQTPNFTMLNASPGDYVGKRLTLYGNAELQGYYNYGYTGAENTHYSVRLRDLDYEAIDVYFPKKGNKELFEILGRAGSEDVPLKVEVVELPSRYESHSGSFLAEGLDWEVLK